MSDAILIYGSGDDRNSGWSGSVASKERAFNEDANGTTSRRQKETLEWLALCDVTGSTWKELADNYGWHHGQASGVLSTLHKRGLLCRLTQRREKRSIYVLPDCVNDREIALPANIKHNNELVNELDAMRVQHVAFMELVDNELLPVIAKLLEHTQTQAQRIKDLEQQDAERVEKEKYQGWCNYETWATWMWLDNTQELYESRDSALRKANSNAVHIVADAFKEWVKGLIDQDDALLTPDLKRMRDDIGSAFRINWRELAEHWLEYSNE